MASRPDNRFGTQSEIYWDYGGRILAERHQFADVGFDPLRGRRAADGNEPGVGRVVPVRRGQRREGQRGQQAGPPKRLYAHVDAR